MIIKKFSYKQLIKTFSAILISAGLILTPISASALSLNNYFASASSSAACDALNTLNSSQGCGKGNGSSAVSSLTSTIINILSIIVGIVAVIMIIVNGLRFITSGGDSNKVGAAKSGLIYALVGLAIVALAQFIIRFVISQSNGATTPSGP